ncbi:uncharacterized protein LOC131931791 [Physella acuta]|uniref:uncharacterized protein LOC131931791 n=1 Tax=Physella acuta TaxID=109671 RepID=UPI0027DB4FC9|nr:uncharacterized protein LOC131931791 [Physella acuta]XP_059144626.1 uncharacterized protein LOC131931791 [Physella acuta]XP_059144627.1 uncharacterized protein LOC131931791 [Physella acuta]
MNCCSTNCQQRTNRLKACPDGSSEFHKVLDEIYTEHHTDTTCEVSTGCDASQESQNGEGRTCHEDNEPGIKRVHDSNNNSRGTVCTCQFGRRLFTIRDTALDESAQDVLLSHLPLDRSSYKIKSREAEDVVKLPELDNMGTSCSSNFYDRRDWHSVADGCPADPIKNGRKGRLLKNRSQDDNFCDISALPSLVCTCNQLTDKLNSTDKHIANGNSKTGTDKRMSLSPLDHSSTSSRLSPSVDSSGHIKLSRVFGSGRARATSNCDVSPHRLLTRRNNSPSGRTSSLDSGSIFSSHEAMRQRSHSWSNGKLSARPSYLKSGSMMRSSILSPVGHHKSISPSLNSTKQRDIYMNSSKSPVFSKQNSQGSFHKASKDIHSPDCPMHVKSNDLDSLSSGVLDNMDDSFSPVLRQRSASESHTTRPRRLLPRTPSSTDGSSILEHNHVRWADEEKGSSLSTSVFLTSIRPRSYSYGASDGPPQRPILKKVPVL